ncbi:hypothetical protein FACS1894161_0480 [Spirochaetia bacterium]|nr:hypothetical protein FACS1894161_0480 [Spirochaetia bacterium]
MTAITVSIDEQILTLGMKYAKQHSISFDVLVMQSIEQRLQSPPKQWWQETLNLMSQAHGNSGGEKWVRDELYCG